MTLLSVCEQCGLGRYYHEPPASFGRAKISYEPRCVTPLQAGMKLTIYAICALGVIISNFGCTTATDQAVSTAAPSAPAVVTIDFVHPGRFTDFRINNRDFQHSSTIFTRDVTSALRPVMARRFPGHTLKLRYTNIDLAARRTPGPQGIRLVGGSTPPWLAFDYLLQNPSGRTIASGSQRLVSSAPTSSSQSRSRPVQIEADMMQRWLQTLRVPQS
jgi:DUF3016 family protein